MSLKIYELAPDRFSLYQHQQWQAALRKAKVKLGLSSVLRYGKGNDKYLNDYDKNQNYPFLNIGMSIIYMVGRNY